MIILSSASLPEWVRAHADMTADSVSPLKGSLPFTSHYLGHTIPCLVLPRA
jgi:hypothetical protein